jgi:hypothetical protein
MKTKWTLVSVATGKVIDLGDVVTAFDGERVTLIGLDPPHKQGAIGRVFVLNSDLGMAVTTHRLWERGTKGGSHDHQRQ